MKKILNNKGEGYIDICVGIIALLSVLVLTLNVYSFLTLKQDLDEISEQLIETATYSGCFGDEFNQRADQLRNQLFDFEVETSADSYYNASYKRVQLGNTMKVKQGKNATDGIDTAPFYTSLKRFCTLDEHDGKLYSMDTDGTEKFSMTVPTIGYLEDEKLELYASFTMYVPIHFAGQTVTTASVPVKITSALTSKN